MTTKIIVTLGRSALVAFGAGTDGGMNREAAAPLPAVVDQSEELAALDRDNRRLTDETAALRDDLAELRRAYAERTAQLAALAAQAAEPTAAAGPSRSPHSGGRRHELQQAVLNNLRQIDAARQQHQWENGQAAASIEDLVGVGLFIKTVRTVGGEPYYDLSMTPGQPLTVTTPDGVSVTYDPAGPLTTQIEVPPAVQRAEELGAKVQPLMMKAIDAYREAHGGEMPPSEEAFIPYFSTPEEGADYLEFMEARAAAGL